MTQSNDTSYYLRQVNDSEHWKRLWDWSFCPSLCVSVFRLAEICTLTSGPVKFVRVTNNPCIETCTWNACTGVSL